MTTPASLCDCELGHNGFGMAGRVCDCPAGRSIRVVCEACGGEGHILRASAINPYEDVDLGTCPECDGAAYVTVETMPVTLPPA